MSRVEIEIPDDRWFRGEWQIRPQDKQLCVVILNQGSKIPRIFQYREDMNNDFCFFDIENCVDYFEWKCVNRWKPLGLPADVNERIVAEIEKWFEED